jgi:hypothetical protein
MASPPDGLNFKKHRSFPLVRGGGRVCSFEQILFFVKLPVMTSDESTNPRQRRNCAPIFSKKIQVAGVSLRERHC